jgi:hypothetical protein
LIGRIFVRETLQVTEHDWSTVFLRQPSQLTLDEGFEIPPLPVCDRFDHRPNSPLLDPASPRRVDLGPCRDPRRHTVQPTPD